MTTPEDMAAVAVAPGTLSFSLDDYHTSDRSDAAEEEKTVAPAAAERRPSAAAALPTEVIQQILYLVDPETFMSMTLVHRAWRAAANVPQIYAYHLSRCPSYARGHSILVGPFKESDLPRFKQQLVQEAKRSLFVAFLQPQQTVVNLISTTTSSSAAFPCGESFEFTFSSRAQLCLAISSSRIIVLDTAAALPVVRHELKVRRRPLSAAILADGSLLAVLAANHRVNLYDLTRDPVMFKRSIELDETAHTIALTVGGEVLAAGCEGGVEVVSLSESGPHTTKRVIKCDRVDHLSFSTDGTMMLGTTQQSPAPSTTILTAPYFTDYLEHDMEPSELLSHLWTSQIIFPNSSHDCSHSALLPRNQDHDANWTLAYDRVFESFRAVRTDDLRNGTTYFTGPQPSSLSPQQQEREQRQRERERNRRSKSAFTPKTLPAITPHGQLVAAAFLTSDIWLYGVPDDLEHPGIRYGPARPGFPAQTPDSSNPPSPRHSRREVDRLPRWQVLVDKYRNVFAKGSKVASVTGASVLCWCTPSSPDPGAPRARERLVIAAPGGVSDSSDLQDRDLASVDGGRLVLLDFELGSSSGETKEITIEVGSMDPQMLEEEDMDMDAEIAVMRRRTLARQEGVSRLTVSSVADVLRPATLDNAPPVPPVPAAVGFGLDRTGTDESTGTVDSFTTPAEHADATTLEEAIDGLDGPYSQTGPRSRGTVYRSSAAVEANRRRNPRTPANQEAPRMRRTDGTELPHESDADNWVPPPPAYGKHTEDDRPPQDERRSTTRSHTAAEDVSPTRSPTIPRRPVGSPSRVRRSLDARRRNSANIEGTRWMSRHESNRAVSPIGGDDESLERSQSLRETPSPVSPRRPTSTYTPRSSIYRAALQPPTTIEDVTASAAPPPPSRHSLASALPGRPSTSTTYDPRLEPDPLFSAPENHRTPRHTVQPDASAIRERSVSPLVQGDTNTVPPSQGRVYQPPRLIAEPPAPRTAPAPAPAPAPASVSGVSLEPSAYQSTVMALGPQPHPPLQPQPQPQPQPLAQPREQRKRKSFTLSRIGRSTTPDSSGRGPSPARFLSAAFPARQPSPAAPAHQPSPYVSGAPTHPPPATTAPAARTGTASSDPSAPIAPNSPPTPHQKSRSFARRSLRFGRPRPQTADPAALAAAAPLYAPGPTSGGAAAPSPSHERGLSHTMSLVDPNTPVRRGWERRPRDANFPAVVEEASEQQQQHPRPRRRSSHHQHQQGQPRRVSGPPATRPPGDTARWAEISTEEPVRRRGGKCVLM